MEDLQTNIMKFHIADLGREIEEAVQIRNFKGETLLNSKGKSIKGIMPNMTVEGEILENMGDKR